MMCETFHGYLKHCAISTCGNHSPWNSMRLLLHTIDAGLLHVPTFWFKSPIDGWLHGLDGEVSYFQIRWVVQMMGDHRRAEKQMLKGQIFVWALWWKYKQQVGSFDMQWIFCLSSYSIWAWPQRGGFAVVPADKKRSANERRAENERAALRETWHWNSSWSKQAVDSVTSEIASSKTFLGRFFILNNTTSVPFHGILDIKTQIMHQLILYSIRRKATRLMLMRRARMRLSIPKECTSQTLEPSKTHILKCFAILMIVKMWDVKLPWDMDTY